MGMPLLDILIVNFLEIGHDLLDIGFVRLNVFRLDCVLNFDSIHDFSP